MLRVAKVIPEEWSVIMKCEQAVAYQTILLTMFGWRYNSFERLIEQRDFMTVILLPR